ncbi:FAD-binding protein [Pareuzebyella sediminis]|uniref:FAD-binding protein n=1 Tax=Pareuzebyella sediminis TaxID=2607998 RepID=UPI0011EF799C|nr:FAD-binding protein [Pareuzebyella sediminis]
MARTTKYTLKEWDTLHNNGPFKLKALYKTKLEGSGIMPSKIDRYNDAAQEIRRLIGEAQGSNEGFRAHGSAWSMSNIAHQGDRMHFNAHMNLRSHFSGQEIHETSPYKAENVFLVQCGNTIKEISAYLEAHGKSLKTTGASNGQTIAGCISTGVHGSAFGVGSVQDYIIGINLIIGPNEEDVVYLERHTKPVLTDAFIQKINARVIRNDGLFNAALVGLGSFGFIHGVVIEAEDLFLLKRYVRKIDKNTALELAEGLDFENSPFKIEEETNDQGQGTTPYHYKVFINQYSKEANEYVVECIYKKPYRQSYPDPFPIIKQSIYGDLINLIISISRKFPKSIPAFVKSLEKTILPAVDEVTTGTLSETFWDAPYQGPAFACSFGVDHSDSAKALKVLTELTKTDGPIPGIFAMRFIKQSEAILSFAKFPITCMIEIDGVLWKKSRKLISLKEFSRRMIIALMDNDIPFTIHWGKNADWGFPNLVSHMYGEKADTWKAYRSALLSKDMQLLFSNDFLKTLGLFSEEEENEEALEDLIASL